MSELDQGPAQPIPTRPRTLTGRLPIYAWLSLASLGLACLSPVSPLPFPVPSLSFPVSSLSFPVSSLSFPVSSLSFPVSSLSFPVFPCLFPVSSLSFPVSGPSWCLISKAPGP